MATGAPTPTSALKVTTLGGVKIYNCSAGKTLPQWYEEAKKRKGGGSLRYDQEYRTRIELIQDFTFPTASGKVKSSADGRFLVATGVYPPQIKVFEAEQLSMKFERHIDAEVVQFQLLSDDWSKMIFLRVDRTIEVHAQFGNYFKLRIPKFGRDMAYHYSTCDLFVGASSPEVYRVNLDQGLLKLLLLPLSVAHSIHLSNLSIYYLSFCRPCVPTELSSLDFSLYRPVLGSLTDIVAWGEQVRHQPRPSAAGLRGRVGSGRVLGPSGPISRRVFGRCTGACLYVYLSAERGDAHSRTCI